MTGGSRSGVGVVALLAALGAACGGHGLDPENQLTAKRAAFPVEIVGDGLAAGGGARLGTAALAVQSVDATGSGQDLVLRAATDALALVGRREQAAARAAEIGSLLATSEEHTLVRARGVVGGRGYDVSCASTATSSGINPTGKLELSCAIVREVETPARHWQLRMSSEDDVITTLHVGGVLEPHTASGVESGLHVFRVLSHGPFFMPHTRLTVDGGDEADLYAIVMLRTYGRAPKVFVDDARMAGLDEETRDVARLLPLVVELYPWPEQKPNDE